MAVEIVCGIQFYIHLLLLEQLFEIHNLVCSFASYKNTGDMKNLVQTSTIFVLLNKLKSELNKVLLSLVVEKDKIVDSILQQDRGHICIIVLTIKQ